MAVQTKKSVVALVRCESYERREVQAAVNRGISLIGGLDPLFKKGENILLKPNALSGKSPDQCVTTHPEVFRAVADAMLRYGLNLSYGDSPSLGKPQTVLEKTGLSGVAEEFGIPRADFDKGKKVSFPGGVQNRQFTIAKGVLESDGIISLPKLKTHHLTRMTGAIKNQFGCIPGFLKPEFHVRLPSAEPFSKMLVDLNRLLRPRLFIMDAVEAMEGNGPGSGDPVALKFLLFSTDPVAVDSIAGKLINIKPEQIFTTRYGYEYGLGNMQDDMIEVVGDNPLDFIKSDFKIERGSHLQERTGWIYHFAKSLISNKPVIDSKLCKRCGICLEQCPVHPRALFWQDNNKTAPPAYDYQLCIRCFCCQEVCPYKAIQVKTPLLKRIIRLFYR